MRPKTRALANVMSTLAMATLASTLNLISAWHAVRKEARYIVHDPEAGKQAERSSSAGQQEALRKELTHEPSPAGTQSDANSHLSPST